VRTLRRHPLRRLGGWCLRKGNLIKGDKIYAEGHLKLSHWNDKSTGEAKHGLQITAWKVTKLGAIGRRKLKGTRDGAGNDAELASA
jgi:single-stranded DNA-binding protein